MTGLLVVLERLGNTIAQMSEDLSTIVAENEELVEANGKLRIEAARLHAEIERLEQSIKEEEVKRGEENKMMEAPKKVLPL